MKKQIFLLASLLFASPVVVDADCCSTSCNTSCNTGCSSSCSSSCDNDCVLTHGQTYRRYDNQFQNGTPLYESLWSTDVIRNLENDDKHGGLEVVVFGGKNTGHSDSAKYYFPYGHSKYTFDGSIVTPETFASNIAWRHVQTQVTSTAAGTTGLDVARDQSETNPYALTTYGAAIITDDTEIFASDATTYQFDANKDTSKLLPWNFGITYAALFEPIAANALGGKAGVGLITSPEFKSTICPELFYSHVGGGFALRYQFCDDKQGFFVRLSTAVENVKSKICLNENVISPKTELTSANFPQQASVYGVRGTAATTGTATTDSDNPYGLTTTQMTTAGASGNTLNVVAATAQAIPFNLAAGADGAGGAGEAADIANLLPAYLAQVAPKGSINAAYLNGTEGTGFPADQEGETIANGAAPANAAEAFVQSAWKYGKMGCTQSVTRLADIELVFGYQWLCSDCASNNWYVGIVIPTGNKPCADWVAPAVVGNGQHVGLMVGSSLELMLSENECRSVWYRLDTNSRYLFNNTQKRSFDLLGNEWSRYMMVWESKEAYTAALEVVGDDTTPAASRNYTPGINVFTADMKVSPRFQFRLNQAVYFQSEKFRAELGWNIFARSKECVKLACSWDAAPAFADSSYIGGVGLNNNRTIYNDAQTMGVNQTANLSITNNSGQVENLAGFVINGTAQQNAYDNFVITADQINLDSAATPAAILNTPYATIGWAWGCGDYKPIVSVGASYEFSAGNNTLNQWMVWGKFEFAF